MIAGHPVIDFHGHVGRWDALDMVDRAKKAFVPPFVNHVFADPAGSFTTGAAMVAQVSRALRQKFNTDLTGKRIVNKILSEVVVPVIQ